MKQPLGWIMMLFGGVAWLSWKYGLGPLADAGRLPMFVALAVLCWGGIILATKGEADTKDEPASPEDET